MGKPVTLLERLCGHALSLGAESIEVEYKDRREWVFARQANVAYGIANFPSSSADAKDLRLNLCATGLIEKTPGQARSIRLLVQPEHLPRLE